MHISYQDIHQEKNPNLPNPLPFGKIGTNHVFLMDFNKKEWVNPRIVPNKDIPVSLSAVVLHYGQAAFEGAKAFWHEDDEIYTFRIDENAKRMNNSARILCMPRIPVEDQIEAIHSLIDVDRYWVPKSDDCSLYIRPFMFGSDSNLGVKPSTNYTFAVILKPSGPYYKDGFKPNNLMITKKFHRAAPGGTGAAKAAGNYAMSLRAGELARRFGANQVLYLDVNNEFIEEAGAMNHYHVLKDETIIIPEWTDTILKSITSKSVLELSESHGFKARQEHIRINNFLEQIYSGEIIEAGGFGTAAVVAPVGKYLLLKDEIIDEQTIDDILDDKIPKNELEQFYDEIIVGDGNIGMVTKNLYQTYNQIQRGKLPAPDGWLMKVEKKFLESQH
ncbi:MAG: branched-chain amino acid aminotransferase [Nanoarchaeota archaeon]|nr:branched-chain amino acid aminotransferase [Nanoarchaeota archaeon]MBU1270470.1 branched-chain amino acid aminotransferase [Nanoarchaeota archaeon]MBU1605051.1 branched-chain amino acid aminotransferase [Nanoarchaeota archaeon]MBU2443706.1 branched-chain amino acid aminotransferase [Nanoarchaeota archaeon]